jgi:Domain of unknown function (DUF5753)
VHADALPAYFEGYVGLEDGAKSLFTYQNQLVHGLMQTETYAAAVIRAAQPAASTDEAKRPLAARTTRQSLLTAPTPLQVWVVFDEAVLRRHVIGTAVIRDHLSRIRDVAALPNVTLQVIQFDIGARASMGTSFESLQFPEPGDGAIVYVEDQTAAASACS